MESIKVQWEEDRMLAFVVIERRLVCSNLTSTCHANHGHCWIISAHVKAHVLPISTDGVLSHHSSVIVDTSGPWITLSTHVIYQCLLAGWWDCIKLMMMQSTGWKNSSYSTLPNKVKNEEWIFMMVDCAEYQTACMLKARVSTSQNAVILIRILRDLCQRIPTWQPLGQWVSCCFEHHIHIIRWTMFWALHRSKYDV